MSLTRSQGAALERRLAGLSRAAQDKIRDTLPKQADEKFLDRAGMALDEGDEAMENVQEAFNHTLLERYLAELRQIEAAQKRLLNGEIDCCADCGEEIGYKRLLAHPLATRCIGCQAFHEETRGAQPPRSQT